MGVSLSTFVAIIAFSVIAFSVIACNVNNGINDDLQVLCIDPQQR